MKGLPISAAPKTVDHPITCWKGRLHPRLTQLPYWPFLSASDSVSQWI